MELEWCNASKSYGEKTAVKDLSLTVSEGEILVLIGPSGCGKTTSLKMINRLVEPSKGFVMVDGKNVRESSPTELRRHIGYVIQQVGLFPHMTVADNVATVPRMLKWSKEEIKMRVEELLDLVGLEPSEYSNAWPTNLSGGEAQRVGVARALAADPPILLMDEPFSAVDPLTREQLQSEFLRIQTEVSKTVIAVTHDLDEAIRLGNRIAVMNEGELVDVVPPGELMLHKDPFIRDFTGDNRALRRLASLNIGDLLDFCAKKIRAGSKTNQPVSKTNQPVSKTNQPVSKTNQSVSKTNQPVSKTTNLRDALSIMLEKGSNSLEIMSDQGTCIGQFTMEELIETASGNISR